MGRSRLLGWLGRRALHLLAWLGKDDRRHHLSRGIMPEPPALPRLAHPHLHTRTTHRAPHPPATGQDVLRVHLLP